MSNRRTAVSSAWTIALVATLASWHADAAQRTFVATSGADNPACSLASPCRTFNAAIGAVAANGEVIVLDSGGYGPAFISKSVSLIASPGVYAGVSVANGFDGITISAPGSAVVLRGLSINGQGGNDGIRVTGAARVRIENCVVSAMGSIGIEVSATGSNIEIVDSIVRDNAGDGVYLGAALTASVERTQLLNNGENGLQADAGANVTLANVTSSNNALSGLLAHANSTQTTRMAVASSVMSDNTLAGVRAQAAQATSCVRVTVANSTLTRQASGIEITSPAAPSDQICGVYAVSDANTISESGVGFNIASPFVGLIYTRQNNTLYRNASDVSILVNLQPLAAK